MLGRRFSGPSTLEVRVDVRLWLGRGCWLFVWHFDSFSTRSCITGALLFYFISDLHSFDGLWDCRRLHVDLFSDLPFRFSCLL